MNIDAIDIRWVWPCFSSIEILLEYDGSENVVLAYMFFGEGVEMVT
jgi:hypothetical protein